MTTPTTAIGFKAEPLSQEPKDLAAFITDTRAALAALPEATAPRLALVLQRKEINTKYQSELRAIDDSIRAAKLTEDADFACRDVLHAAIKSAEATLRRLAGPPSRKESLGIAS